MVVRTVGAIRSGVDFIANSLVAKKNTTREMYELVICTYALTSQKALLANTLVKDIEKMANYSGSYVVCLYVQHEYIIINKYANTEKVIDSISILKIVNSLLNECEFKYS